MRTTTIVTLMIALIAACSSRQGDQGTTPDTTENSVEGPFAEAPADEAPQDATRDATARRAVAELETTQATKLEAAASFEETGDGVKVVLQVQNAKPGKQAVHVHEIGDCSDIAGKSMGEHFAPDYQQHALPDTELRHIGDLGNIEIDREGKGTLEITAKRATLKPRDPTTFLGKALVVHEGEDKGTGPSGDSGTPVACGVIEPPQD
jgi:Cu-Zn family superoxide dismutase